MVNTGKADGSVAIDKILSSDKENAGYDALKDKFSNDLIKDGIIDPVRVTKSALRNAASAAGILLTTEVAIADEPEESKPGMSDMGGMGM